MYTDTRPFFLRWASRLFALIRGYFFTVGILTTVLVGALFYMLAKGKSTTGHHPPLASDAKVVLHLKLEGLLQEKSEDLGFWQDIVSQATGKKYGPDVLALQHQIDMAAQDPRIVGLFVENGSIEGSYPVLETLRSAFLRFTATKKPLIFWSYHLSDKSLYLGSAATSLAMPPLGEAQVGEPAFQPMYFGEALHKLGVEIEIVRVGKYKSAVEPLISNAMSPEARQMYEKLETELRQQWMLAVGQGRHKTTAQMQKWVKQTLFSAPEAREQGMIDTLQYFEEGKEAALSATKATWLAFSDYEGLPDAAPLYGEAHATEPGIAYIEAVGQIRMGHGRAQEDTLTPEDLAEPLKWAREEKKIKAVLLFISSPGGDSSAADLMWREVAQVAKEKPVVVSMGAMAASGGYYIASGATHIMAHPATLTGSIGVFMIRPSFGGFEAKYGLSFPRLGEATDPAFWYTGAKMSPAAYQSAQHSVEGVYTAFLARVAQNRKWTSAQVHAVAQGYVWSGAGAKAVGLVDELGGFAEAVKRTQKLAGFTSASPGPLYRWHPTYDSLQACLQKAPSLGDCFPFSKVQSQIQSGFQPVVLREMERLQAYLSHWQQQSMQMWAPIYIR